MNREQGEKAVPASADTEDQYREISPATAKRSVTKQVAVVVWEDITAYTRVEIPEDFEVFRLNKITVGMLWREAPDYLVLVQDYDVSNRGKGYRHNDFHIIPRGAIREVRILGQVVLPQ